MDADYVKVKRMYDRQTKYSTLRGMMYAKGPDFITFLRQHIAENENQ